VNKKVTDTEVGGGVAGILSAVFLSKIKNFGITVFEKAKKSSISSHGLKELCVYKDILSRGSL
jgi:glycine/D-amino acid oxidase-like deaminating enzyme